MAALYGLYAFGRLLAADQESEARANARIVRALDNALPLPSGAAVQEWCSEGVLQLANTYYVFAHFPVTIAFLVWGFAMRPRSEYVWARNLLTALTFLGLVLHILIPLAPPRMFPLWGFQDTMAILGPSSYEGSSGEVANQIAAMPSLHVGWAVLVAIVVARTASKPMRALAVAHAVITFGVVIVTANHWWVDGIVAVALLLVVLRFSPGPGGVTHSGRGTTRQSVRPSGRRIGIRQRDGARVRHATRAGGEQHDAHRSA